MIPNRSSGDRAGKGHWDQAWASLEGEPRSDEFSPRLRNYVNRRLARLFKSELASLGADRPGSSFLEVGCGHSKWLPYFNKQCDFRVVGIDYSEIGCAQARQALSSRGAVGEIVCADIFRPPEEMLGKFDIVFSNGVVEHFDDTAACLSAIGRFLRPGGIAITSIPNFAGLFGTAQKVLGRQLYDIHVPLSAVQLRTATTYAGLEVQSCDYFLFMNSGILMVDAESSPSHLQPRRLLIRALHALSYASWLVDGAAGRLPTNRFTSPFIVCVARKPA